MIEITTPPSRKDRIFPIRLNLICVMPALLLLATALVVLTTLLAFTIKAVLVLRTPRSASSLSILAISAIALSRRPSASLRWCWASALASSRICLDLFAAEAAGVRAAMAASFVIVNGEFPSNVCWMRKTHAALSKEQHINQRT